MFMAIVKFSVSVRLHVLCIWHSLCVCVFGMEYVYSMYWLLRPTSFRTWFKLTLWLKWKFTKLLKTSTPKRTLHNAQCSLMAATHQISHFTNKMCNAFSTAHNVSHIIVYISHFSVHSTLSQHNEATVSCGSESGTDIPFFPPRIKYKMQI